MSNKVPNNEIHFAFARSSGAGGQNVNKTSTKVWARWAIGKSPAFSVEEKNRIRAKLSNKINFFDELVAVSEEERSQAQNRVRATARLQDWVESALKIPKKRRPTRPTLSSKIKRLDSKKLHARVKAQRRAVWD